MNILPDGNIVPDKEHNCTTSCLAETDNGESNHKISDKCCWRTVAYKFKSQRVCPLDNIASCHEGPG